MARRDNTRGGHSTPRRTGVKRDHWSSDDDQQSAPPRRRIAAAGGNKISKANTIETRASPSPNRAVTASSPAPASAAACAAATATVAAASASAGHHRRRKPSLTTTSTQLPHPAPPSPPPCPPAGMRASRPPAGAAKLADQPHRRPTYTAYDEEGDNEDTEEDDEGDDEEHEDEDDRDESHRTKAHPPRPQPSRSTRSRSRSRRSMARIPMSRATSQTPTSRAPSRPPRRDDTISVRSGTRPHRPMMTPDDSDEAAGPMSSGGEDTDDNDGGRQSRSRTKQQSTSLAKLRQRLASTSRPPPQAMTTTHEIVYEDATEDARSMSRPPVERRPDPYRLSRSRRSSPDLSRSRSRSHGRTLLRRYNTSDGLGSRPASLRRASSTVGARMAPAHSRSSSVQRPSYLDNLSYFGASLRAPTPPHKPSNVAACVICMDEKPTKKTVQLQCGHRMCHQCLKRKFELTVSDPQSHMPPRCCRQDQVIPPHHVERLFDSGFKTEWNRKFQEWTTRNRIYCPSRRCGEWIKPQNIRRSEEDPARKLARCSACKTKVCCKCGGRWHRARECPRDEETAKFLEQAKQEGWQRCHRCKSMVELKEGCNHMTCRCGAEFCMICASKWKTCDCPWFNFDAADNDHAAHVGLHDNPFAARPRYNQHEAPDVPSGPPSPREFLQSEPGGFAPVRSNRMRQYAYDDDMLLRRMQGRRKSDGLPRRPPVFGTYDIGDAQEDDGDEADDDDYTTAYAQTTAHGHFMPSADYPRRAESVIVPPVSAAVLPPAPPPPSTVYGGPTAEALDADPVGALDYMAGIPRARPLRSAYSPERRPRVMIPGPATVVASTPVAPERLVRRPTVTAAPPMVQPPLERADNRRWTTSLEQRLADRFAEKTRPGASAASPINMMSPGVPPLPPMPGMGTAPLSHPHPHPHSHTHTHTHTHARGLPHVPPPMSVCGPVPPPPMSIPPMSPPHHMVSAMSPMPGPNPMAPLGIMPQPPNTAHPMMVGRPGVPPLRPPGPTSALMMDSDTNAMMMGFGPSMGMSPWTIGSRGRGGVALSVATADMNRLTPRETATRRVFREPRSSAPEATKQSVLAGLGSQGTGMGRVCEWIAHVPLGAPDGGYETVAA